MTTPVSQRIYVVIHFNSVVDAIEFDWDEENRRHLADHRIAPGEFEELMNNGPVDIDFVFVNQEERYRSVGVTNSGRLLSVVWTIRNGEVRAITAFPARVLDKTAFLRRTQ